jgi:hypothetical protein
MFQTEQTPCLCGCQSSLIFSLDETAPPAHGVRLFYTCPRSKVLMSFGSRGHWGRTSPKGKHQVVQVSRTK